MTFCHSCQLRRKIVIPEAGTEYISGSLFYKEAASYGWKARDSFAWEAFVHGSVPASFRSFVPLRSACVDTTGKRWEAVFYVSRDYFMVGNDKDFARVPITPMMAQRMADSIGCFLPTRKLADLIHAQSRVKLEPVPMYAFRDSTVTMMQHHLMIEGQRKGRKGLISGIKKDVVLCSQQAMRGRANRVAIYGWHRSDGKPIQPLYTGHVNWYVDYSHGIRYVSRRVRVNGKWMDYTDIIHDPRLKCLITDESGEMMLRYDLQ